MDDRVPPDLRGGPQYVRLEVLTDLARAGKVMRQAQRLYFDARKRAPHVTPTAEWNAVRDAERRFDSAVNDALSRERVCIPGMEGGQST